MPRWSASSRRSAGSRSPASRTATSVWLAIAIAGGGLAVVAVAMRFVTPLALTTVDTPETHDAALDYGYHLGQHPAGYVHPGQFHPLTVGRRRRPGSRVGSSP